MESLTRLYKRLEENKAAAGVIFGLNSPALAELVVGGTELDFAVVGLQHADVSAKDLTHMLRAIQAADPMVTPVARLPNHDVYWIQHALDAGYTGLIVPLVESADQARELVRSVYFPPRGCRSVAGSVRATLYGDLVRVANQRTILLPQIESAKGLERVEEIVAVDGVTGVLMGPADLSLDCVWNGQDLWRYEPFLAAVRRVIIACRQNNKVAAILTSPEEAAPALEAGFNMISIGGDQAFARVQMVAEVDRWAKTIASHPVPEVAVRSVFTNPKDRAL